MAVPETNPFEVNREWGPALLGMLTPQPVPLRLEESGSLRVSGTRVSLESVIYAFNNGATPEEIVISFPTVRLEDAYAIIAYYFWHRTDVDEYIRLRDQEAERIREKCEEIWPTKGIRERLLARQKQMQNQS